MHFTRHFLACAFGLATTSVLAQDDAQTTPATPETPTPETSVPLPDAIPTETPTPATLPEGPTANATVNLISRLVQKGILTKEEAVELVQQANQDAAMVQEQVRAAAPPPIDPDGQRVTYIPEVVRKEMRDEIRQELMATARSENWGDDDTPEWTRRIRPFGDLRVRSENLFFDAANNTTGAFPNFNAINTGAPFDTAGNVFSPQYNVDQDRHRARIRARAGAEILLGEGFNGGFRIATGESNSPTSTNQTLGSNGGNFSKYSIWLDRAFLSHDSGPGDGQELLFLLGRFDNPFLSSEVQWDDDIGFDGAAVKARVRIRDDVHFFGAAGLFPVFNTSLNFASNQPEKFESDDKWLTGVQSGIEWKIDEDWSAKIGLAYYDFDNIEGRLSSPFVPLTSSDAGDTDSTRPAFAQRGNTYFPIRNIIPTPANNNGTINQFQYYGLATPFRNLTLTGKVDYDGWDTYRLSALAELTKNVAFDQDALDANAVNNRGADPDGAGPRSAPYDGGDMAWNIAFQFGKPAMEQWGDWMAGIGYRYVESDAIVDGFTDSDFGGGGTNVQGFHIGGSFALSPHVRAGVRWMSSDEIAGPPLKSDTLQIDLNAKF
jgi:hypothetical protein